MKDYMGLGLRHLKKIFNMVHAFDLMVPASKNLTVWAKSEGGPELGPEGGPEGPPPRGAHSISRCNFGLFSK